MRLVRPERPNVEQTRQDRTEQAIFFHPLWLNSPFSHQLLQNCSVSFYERHPDGTMGSKASKQIRESRGTRQQWEGMSEHIKIWGHRGAADKISNTPALFSLVLVDLQTNLSRAVRLMLTCLCSSAAVYSSQRKTRVGRTLLSCWFLMVKATFPRPSKCDWPQAAI